MATFPLSLLRLDRTPLVSALVGMATGSWRASFQEDVCGVAGFMAARIEPLMREDIDCVVSFERIPLGSISQTNPDRISVTPRGGYPMLRHALESDPAYDSVPVSVGRSGRGTALWDGHRRVATYRSAGRQDVPAWVATFRRGNGTVRTP